MHFMLKMVVRKHTNFNMHAENQKYCIGIKQKPQNKKMRRNEGRTDM